MLERGDRPLPTGKPVGQRTLVEPGAFPIPSDLPLRVPVDWGRLQQEYLLYSPGLLYAHVRLDRDPFLEFEAFMRRSVPRWKIELPRRLFLGLSGGDYPWGSVLHAVQRAEQDHLLDFLGSLAFWDREAKLFVRLGTQWLDLWDPWDPSERSPLRIAAVALSTNRGQVVWARPQGPGMPCQARFLAPQKEVLDFARQFIQHVQA